VTDVTDGLPYGVHPLSEGSGPDGTFTAADLDLATFYNQRLMWDNRTLLPFGACHMDGFKLIGPEFKDEITATIDMRRHFPDAVLEFRESNAGDGATQPKLDYSLRTYAMYNVLPGGQVAAQRTNLYNYLTNYFEDRGYDGNAYCGGNNVYPGEDGQWFDPTQSLYPTSFPQITTLNYLHNAFLRSVIRHRAGQTSSTSFNTVDAADAPDALPTPPGNATVWLWADRPRIDTAFSQFPRVYFYP